MLSIAIVLFAIIDYVRDVQVKKSLSLLQQYLKADTLWSSEVNNRLIELDNWVKAHDKKEKKK
jgi:hypothetical protein